MNWANIKMVKQLYCVTHILYSSYTIVQFIKQEFLISNWFTLTAIWFIHFSLSKSRNLILMHWKFINYELIHWLSNFIDWESYWLFCSYSIVSEVRITQHHKKQILIIGKLLPLIIIKRKKLKSKSINSDHQIYDDITFDVIKRGPLLVLFIGLSFVLLSFIHEVLWSCFYKKNLALINEVV